MIATTTDQELLAQLQEEEEKTPALQETISLHQELIAARAALRPAVPELKPDRNQVEELINQRVPLISRWELPWDEQSFTRLAAEICDIAGRHRQDLASQFERIRSLLTDNAEQTQDIVTRYLREREVKLPAEPDTEPELLSFVLNNALHPFMRAYATVLTPLIEEDKWYQRFCPLCGGEPDFGYLEKKVGGLRLLCSRCDTAWMYKRGECSFCGNSRQDTFAYYLSDDEVYRLYVCDECKRYLKVLDGRQTSRKPTLPLYRITTIGMDISAHQEGYH